MKVTYLGPSGTFTHQAVLALRPDAESMPLTTQADALDAVVAGEAAYAVLPIDNSVNGVVVPTLDALLQRPELSIIDSAVVPISFDAFTRDPAIAPTRRRQPPARPGPVPRLDRGAGARHPGGVVDGGRLPRPRAG